MVDPIISVCSARAACRGEDSGRQRWDLPNEIGAASRRRVNLPGTTYESAAVLQKRSQFPETNTRRRVEKTNPKFEAFVSIDVLLSRIIESHSG
jgi:hypothetical protein